jgi:hypothetical protein
LIREAERSLDRAAGTAGPTFGQFRILHQQTMWRTP